MAEKSILWTTGATGDGATEYTQAELIRWLRQSFLGDNTDEGVCKNYENELEVTGTSTPVAVNTGAAYVYGFPYWNTASVDVAIPTPSGNTRIDRVVLRANWTAQTVRITRIAGTEGSGTPPALTQTDGTTWEISLAQVSITTGGVITVTDERVFCHANIEVETAMLEDDAVDDTKVGNRVPQFYRRKGGSATDWDVAGTTTYTPTTVRMQAGVHSVTISNGNDNQSGSITFPVSFSAAPIVIICVSGNANVASASYESWVIAGQPTTGDVDYIIFRPGTTGDRVFNISWQAIGPE